MIVTYNHGHNICDFLIFYQIFHSPQEKRSETVISNKNGIYKLPNELPLVPSLPPKIKILQILLQNCSKADVKRFLRSGILHEI